MPTPKMLWDLVTHATGLDTSRASASIPDAGYSLEKWSRLCARAQTAIFPMRRLACIMTDGAVTSAVCLLSLIARLNSTQL